MVRFGIGWTQVRQAVDHDLGVYQEAARAQWQAAGVPSDVVAQLSGISGTVAQLFPALLAIASVAGLRLAWAWYHRVSTRPLGVPPPPFPAFRFSDQLVWGWVVALGLASSRFPIPRRWWAPICCCLWTTPLRTRGLAVLLAGAGQVPAPVLWCWESSRCSCYRS